MQKGRTGEVYNICSENLIWISGILDQLVAISGRSIRIETDPATLSTGKPTSCSGQCKPATNINGLEAQDSIRSNSYRYSGVLEEQKPITSIVRRGF
jgi:hypothetical protein